MEKKSLVNRAYKVIVALSVKAATKEANSACSFWSYQSKEPDAVKKLRKF